MDEGNAPVAVSVQLPSAGAAVVSGVVACCMPVISAAEKSSSIAEDAGGGVSVRVTVGAPSAIMCASTWVTAMFLPLNRYEKWSAVRTSASVGVVVGAGFRKWYHSVASSSRRLKICYKGGARPSPSVAAVLRRTSSESLAAFRRSSPPLRAM